jgi:nucleotide-binding universal stress UspA family protein
MKKIMFATAFYDHAPEAFKYAVKLAYSFKADLLMMHAHGKPEPMRSNDELIKERHDNVIEKLVEFTTTHLPENYREKIKIDYLAVNAYPFDGILETALDQKVDLIVIGMTGRTSALGSILGNTTLNVLAKADCQVLMIPKAARFKGINDLLYTLDFEFRDLQAIHYLKDWSQALDATLHALHVVEGDEDQMTILRKLMIIKETFKKDQNIDFDLRYGHFRTEIEQFALGKKADIVTMISHKQNFISRLLDSNALEEIAQQIDLPLLVIKEDAYEFDEAAWEWVEFLKSIA